MQFKGGIVDDYGESNVPIQFKKKRDAINAMKYLVENDYVFIHTPKTSSKSPVEIFLPRFEFRRLQETQSSLLEV